MTTLWRTLVGVTATSVVAASALTGVTSPGAEAAPAPGWADARPVRVHAVASHYRRPSPAKPWQARRTRWPSGTRQVSLPGSGSAAPVRAGDLPVWLAPAATNAPPLASAQVDVRDRAAAARAGVQGVLLSVRPAAAGSVRVRLRYDDFRDAFGGDWATRLHLVQLPACALTTPQLPTCRTQRPLRTANDTRAGTVEASVSLAASSAGATVLAAASSGSGGSGGDFTATSLKPSGSWSAGGSTDSFTWSYPIGVPDVPGGLKPDVTLSYSSQSQDGLTSSTNNQPSIIGDGWDYSPGFIERSFASCHDNPSGSTRTFDNCWSNRTTLSLSLNGASSGLVKDDATGTYHAQGDQNDRIEYVAGANGTSDGEHWRVTTTDGTQYYFGQNKLPGWGTDKPVTGSVWTEPVYSTGSDQPCWKGSFAASVCDTAYRWNLDYVVDPHGDAIAYYYGQETNRYARNLGSTGTGAYVRGGYLQRIDYGLRDGTAYSATPAGQVVFTVNGRCKTSPTGCAVSTLNSSTATNWPDVPYDLNCGTGTCQIQAPTFWSQYELTGIQTKALVGSALAPVDSWSLKHSFPSTGDSTQPALWLDSITRTGQDTSGGGSTAAITLPPVTFTGIPMANRTNLGNGYAPITRRRLYTITTETGSTVTVNYSAPACGSSTPSDPSANTRLCYPAYWTPAGEVNPRLDWFNKYIVTGVTTDDATGGSANDTQQTTYTPVGAPAWHYDTNPLTASNQRTWNDWRGFAGMIVTTGTAPDPITKVQYSYFRGMDGDTLPNGGTRSVTLADSRNEPAVPDADQFAGMAYETRVFNGSAVISDTINDPWTSDATATHAVSGLPAQRAFHVGQAGVRTYVPLASGGTQATQVTYTHDAYGRVSATDDLGDVSTAADDLCTTVTYADNTSAWILDTPSRTQTVSARCSATPNLPGDAVSDTLTYYDLSTTLGAPPGKGDVTMTQQATSYNGATPVYTTTSTAIVDGYGRPTTTTDPLNRKTVTAYTPATGAQPTSVAVTDPAQLTSSTTLEQARGLVLATTSPAGYADRGQYDALGRLTAVFRHGQTSSTVPSQKYGYTLSNTGPSVVDAYQINEDLKTYRVTKTLFDSQLRAREVQAETPSGNRTVTDTIYNTDGWVSETTDPYVAGGLPSGTYVQAQAGDVPSATGFSYDGAGRKVAATAYALATKTWETTYRYGGNFTTTVPPAGRAATTTITDGRGLTTHLYRYHAGKAADPVSADPSDYTDTRYDHDPSGRLLKVTDPAGNQWSWTYDLLGRQTTAVDPDAGTTTKTYDNAGQLKTVTDARGKQTTTTYDNDGRRTGFYDTTATQTLSSANRLGAWTYDTVKKGLPTSTTSYSGGDVITRTTLGYDNQGYPVAIRTNLTGTDAALVPSGGYVTSYGRRQTGLSNGHNDPAAGGLSDENLAIGYDNFGEPTGLGSNGNIYVGSVGYSDLGQPLQLTLSGAPSLYVNFAYDDQTRAVTSTKVTGEPGVIDQTTYRYSNGRVSKGAGLLVGTADTEVTSGVPVTDSQCFDYDDSARLGQAWTATDNCAAVPAPGSSSSVGGPISPYWQSWTYNAAGNRATQVDHDVTGDQANDTTTTYAYPDSGATAAQPHALTSTAATGPGAEAATATYRYDAAGDTTGVTGGSRGDQTYTWDTPGKLASVTTEDGTTSYVYDVDGSLVVRRGPGQTTLFYGDMEISRDNATGTMSGTRYYEFAGRTLAVRTTRNPKVTFLVGDLQGTSNLAVEDVTHTATRRRHLPFGADRGDPASMWPGFRGFVGGTTDAGSGLTNLGAREYNPLTGRFLSVDPVFDATDPQSFNGYGYADENPVSNGDPTGMMCASLTIPEDGGHCVGHGPATDHDPHTKPIDPPHYHNVTVKKTTSHKSSDGGSSWWQKAKHASSDVGDAFSDTADKYGPAILEHSADLATDVGMIAGGITLGSGLIALEVPEFACDLTGVGALACVPAGIVTGAGALASFGTALAGADKLGQDLNSMMNEADANSAAASKSAANDLGADWKPQNPADPKCFTGCEDVAKSIRSRLGGGQIHRISNAENPPGRENFYGIGPYRRAEQGWFSHDVVVKDGRVFDGFTDRHGLPMDEYKALWDQNYNLKWTPIS